jgi:tetratricopeptide (TPR) repeat protein
MTPLSPPDTHHLRAAEGWLELGNHLEANAELDSITPALRSHPHVLDLRWQVCAKAKQWETCVEIGAALVKLAPGLPYGWIHRSFALHELKRTEEALELLEPAASMFTDLWTVPYNLACYACQLGNQDEAWEWLTDAFDLGDPKDVKLMASNDADLEPFWADIGDI